MQVNLDKDEVAALIDAVKSYVADLHSEINHTEDYDMREELKAREVALTSVVTKLGGSVTDTGLSDIGATNPPWG
jgi:hypothetical protein